MADSPEKTGPFAQADSAIRKLFTQDADTPKNSIDVFAWVLPTVRDHNPAWPHFLRLQVREVDALLRPRGLHYVAFFRYAGTAFFGCEDGEVRAERNGPSLDPCTEIMINSSVDEAPVEGGSRYFFVPIQQRQSQSQPYLLVTIEISRTKFSIFTGLRLTPVYFKDLEWNLSSVLAGECKPIPAQVEKALIDRDIGRCQVTNQTMNMMCHIIPKCRGDEVSVALSISSILGRMAARTGHMA